MTWTDYMSQEKEWGEDSPGLRIAKINEKNDSVFTFKKSKERHITVTCNSNDKKWWNKNQQILRKRNVKKNNYVDISGDKLVRLYTRRLRESGPERGPENGTMADLGPLIRHLVSTRLPSGGRAALLSPLFPLYGTRPCV